jgi:hypothetical protein
MIQLQADKEYELLQEVHESVEHGYIDGRPPHHHPSAQEKIFDASHPPHSSIFVTDYQDFVKMSDMEVQLIFRDRHILVLNSPLSDEGFSLKTLKKFCNIKKMVDILGEMQHICLILIFSSQQHLQTCL